MTTRPPSADGLTRRDFFRTALAAGLAGALQPLAGGCSSLGGLAARRLPTRVLGRTGQPVTILGLGGAYFAHRQDEAGTRAILEAALEGGVRLFDTSCDYKNSEERLGPVLAPVRDRVFIITKVNGYDRATAEAELTLSLKRLCTDHVDLLLLHGVGLRESPQKADLMLGRGGALELLQDAKRSGRTRFIGMSAHPGNDTADRFFEASDAWDVVMPFINYLAPAQHPAAGALIEKARRRNVGVVGMKTLGGSGQLAVDYDAAFRYVLSVPGVACALVGVKSVDEVRRAVQAARAFRPLAPREMDALLARGAGLAHDGAPASTLLLAHAMADRGAQMHFS